MLANAATQCAASSGLSWPQSFAIVGSITAVAVCIIFIAKYANR